MWSLVFCLFSSSSSIFFYTEFCYVALAGLKLTDQRCVPPCLATPSFSLDFRMGFGSLCLYCKHLLSSALLLLSILCEKQSLSHSFSIHHNIQTHTVSLFEPNPQQVTLQSPAPNVFNFSLPAYTPHTHTPHTRMLAHHTHARMHAHHTHACTYTCTPHRSTAVCFQTGCLWWRGGPFTLCFELTWAIHKRLL